MMTEPICESCKRLTAENHKLRRQLNEKTAIADKYRADRRKGYVKGLGRAQADYGRVKPIAILMAKELWEIGSELKTGAMCDHLVEEIDRRLKEFPETKTAPDRELVRDWLLAENNRERFIPARASRPGP